MRRLIILIVILAAAAAALYYSQHHRQEARVGPEAVLNALADTQRELSRVPAAMTRMSDEEEIRIGNTLAERYSSQLGTGDAAMQDYVTTVGRKVAAHARRKFDYKFHYVPDEGLVNAFALPGGHVFIGKGMVKLIETEDELASVLGHEVEHIDNYHCVERYQLKARIQGLPLADLLALPVQLFQAGYGKEQEMEADRDGTYLAVLAGYSPQGAVHLFERFGRLHREDVMKAGSPDEELSQVAVAGIEGYFRSHPLPQERVNQIQRIIAAKKWPSVPEKALKVRPEETKTTAVNHFTGITPSARSISAT